jgi:4-amino-4-deoxy-L-arabinose transferase-like glycosyltransferase
VTDRDEARFVQATKQMLETHDFVDIRFQNEPRYKKPIGIYWLQSASVALFSPKDLSQIWAYRIPSLIGIILSVLLTWWAARPIFGRETAFLAAILVASTVIFSWEAHIAKSDAALMASMVAMQGALARLYLFRGLPQARIAVLFWVSLGIGILIKGPVAPALAGLTSLTLLIFDRDRSWLRNFHVLWGLPLMLAIALPWLIAIGIMSDWEFFRLAVGKDFLAILGSGKESQWAPPGIHFLVFWGAFWPAALFATWEVARRLWQNRRQRRVLFLLAWIVPFWLVLEAVPTKLPHYSMPTYPAIAMAVVLVLREMLNGQIPFLRSYRFSSVLWLFVALMLAGAPVFALIYFKVPPSFLMVIVTVLYLGFSLLTIWALWQNAFRTAIVTAIVSAILAYTAIFQLVLPSIEALWPSRQIAEVVNALRPCVKGRVFSAFREPSTVFLTRTDTQLLHKKDKRIALETHEPGEIVIANRKDVKRRPVACIEGFNLNGGKHLRLAVIVSGDAKTYAACPIPERYRCK